MKNLFFGILMFVSLKALAIGQVALCDGGAFNLKLTVYSTGGDSIESCDDCYLVRENGERIIINQLHIDERDSVYRKPKILSIVEPNDAGFYLNYDAGKLEAIDLTSKIVLGSTSCRRMDL